MGDLVQLERMGRELKCPICLSLLNTSVSLTCNHVFCNACIVKSGWNCPVCKVPFCRRDIRPAPHMDNLVSIYKSMELASGFNIFLTQNPPFPQTKLSDENNQVGDSGRQVCENIFHEKGGAQPSFPANKRVRVPHSPISEIPKPYKKRQIGNGAKIKDGFSNGSRARMDDPALNDNGEPALSPFFWLQEENADKLSQLSEGDHFFDITPPDVPTFSDMKDSDDEVPSSSANGGAHGEANIVDLSDSKMFEWTQRPCSPELRTSPVQLKKQAIGRTGGSQRQKSDALSTSEVFHSCSEDFSLDNEKSMSMKQKDGASDDELLAVSGAKRTNNKIGCKKLNNTHGKGKAATLRKCAKKNPDQDFKAHVESLGERGNAIQKDDNERSFNSEKTRRTKKAGPIVSASEPKPKKVRFFSDKENMEETPMVSELLGPSRRQQSDDKYFNVKTGKPCTKNISAQRRSGCLRSKKRKLESIDVQKIDKVDANQSQVNKHINPEVPSSPVSLVDDQKSPHMVLPSSNGPQSKKGLAQKDLRNIQAKDSESREKFRSSTKKIQSTEKITEIGSDSGLDKLESLKKSHKDNNSKRFQCAFCLSSEDSEVTGEMVHYCDGKLVGANQNNISKVIHCHKNCAEWAPNVYFEDDTAFNLEAELARSRRIKCCCCEEKGAALGCYEKSCRKSFHVPCAKQIPECRWDTKNFVMLCPLHVSSKLPNKTTESVGKKRRVSIRQTQKQCNEILKPDTKVPQIWNSIATRGKIVLCCSALTPEERTAVAEFERLSGILVLKNWDSSVTHVIASTDENGACKRTLKILMGILEGKWILNMEWIKASLKAMQTVEEEQYEIIVDVHGIRNGSKLGRQRLLNKQPKIFEGVEFYFMGDFVTSYKKYLQDLVVAGGGIILHRKPIPITEKASSPSSSKQTYIIYSLEPPENFDPSKKNMILNRRKTDAKALATSTGAKAVSNSWVLNSIAACELMSFPE